MKYHENKGKICSVPGCNNLARVKGLCSICYKKEKDKEKVEMYKRFIRIAALCRGNNDYYTLMAIYSGLTNSSLQRLEIIKNIQSKELRKIKELMECKANYQKYRQHFKKIIDDDKSFEIPYFALVIKDLKFYHENFTKIDKQSFVKYDEVFKDICGIVKDIVKCQVVSQYKFSDLIFSFILYFKNCPVLEDEKIRTESTLAQPLTGRSLKKQRSFSKMLRGSKKLKRSATLNPQMTRELRKSSILSQLGFTDIHQTKVENWETNDVSKWLTKIHLDQYKDKFVEHDINGKRLLELLEYCKLSRVDILKEELGIEKIGHRIELMININLLKDV